MDAKIAVQLAKDMQALRGADGDVVMEQNLMQQNVGRRKTIRNIEASHKFPKEKYAVGSLDIAFKRRMTKAHGDVVLPKMYQTLSSARRETVSPFLEEATRQAKGQPEGNSFVLPERYQRMTSARRETVFHFLESARKSIDEERSNNQERRKSIGLHKNNNKRADSVQTITEED